MKKRRILPLLMAAVLMAASIPMAAGATESTEAVQTTEENPEAGAVEGGTESGTVTDENVTGEGSETETETTPSEEGNQEGTVTENTGETTDKPEVIEPEQVESDNVVTLGENLNEEQRAAMYKYFGTSADKVRTIIVTHADEVKYMEGIATAEQIGATTNSCAYVEPTKSGGIKVKTANLNFVTSAMIASTLTTAGMENCNVIAACPFEVSGTGALTGIMMAYETASGENLDEGKKEAAIEELITTGNLTDTLGQEKATEVMNEVKTEIIDKGLTDPEEIGAVVDKIAEDNGVTLTEEQRAQVVSLMEKISQFDYDISALKNTLDSLNGKISGLANAWNSVKSFFFGSGDGILSETNDEALGGDVITDSTVSESGYKDGLLTRIINFFTKGDE